MNPYFVYLGRCQEYNPELIAAVLSKALTQRPQNLPAQGRIVIKPNLVMAHPKIATEAYTRKEVVAGLLTYLQGQSIQMDQIDIVEKSGLGITTSAMYRYAGYRDLKKSYGVRLVAMEESRQQQVELPEGKVHHRITLAKEMVERDYLIFMPKLKTNVLSDGYSGAIKLNIGSIDSKERIYCHHHALPQKMVDILTVCNPQLIVTDGVRLAFGGNQMTQKGADFGVVAISNNAVAHDIVCAKMMGLDPFKIAHIQEAISRNMGPTTLDEIDVLGDFEIERGIQLSRNFDFGNIPVEQFESNFDIKSGTPLCTGGCHGIFLDWLYMVKDRKPKLMKKFPKIPVVIGKIEASIQSKRILLIGDCAKESPNIKAARVVKIKGCPPTHKWIVLNMLFHFFLFNPLVRPSLIWDGFVAYPFKKIKGWVVNLF